MNQDRTAAALARFRRSAIVALTFVASLLSCGREVTGPGAGLRYSQGIAFLAQFPAPMASVAAGAGDIVSFDRIRVVLRRASGAVAIDRTVQFGAGADSVVLDLRVPLESNGGESEPLALNLAYMNAAGDTVFRGGPVSVIAVPEGSGSQQPTPVPVPLTYTGPGASATTVAITPETLTVLAGSPFAFTATARDPQGAAVTSAPVLFTSLDATRAPLASLTSGAGTAGNLRGVARIVAQLAAGGAPDTAVLVVTPRAGALTLRAGGAQADTAGARLADSVKVRLLATDGAGLAGRPVAISVTAGGGSVSSDTLITNADGDVAFVWTLGATVGAQTVTARAAGVSDLVVGATATQPPLVATRLVITQEPSVGQSVGTALAPALRVEARTASGLLVPTFTDSVIVALGTNPSSATLGGTLRVAAVGGIATFGNLTVSAIGAGYTLVATSGALASDTTAAFNVGSAAPSLLTLVAGGGQSGFVNEPIPAPIRVKVTDAFANPSVGVTVTFSVTTGGGSVTGATVSTDSTGQATLGSWTLGATVGAQSITARVTGLTDLVITATAAERPLVATQLVITQEPSTNQVVAAPLAPALRVEARSATGVLVPGYTDSVSIAFGNNPSSATLGGALRVAAVTGVATFPGVSVSALGEGYTLVASATGLASDTSAAFNVGSAGPAVITLLTGDAQTGYVSQPLALPISVKVTDALGNAVAGETVAFAVTAGGGALTGAVVQTDAAGTARLGSWTLGATPGANTITATVVGVAPLTITATGILPPPTIELSVVGSNVVGFERAGVLNVRLLQPAPAGGLVVTLTSSAPSVLAIAAPGSVSFAAGETARTIDVSGLTIGNATVVATGTGYTPDTLVVPVSLNLISLPPTLNVPLTQTRSLPVNLSSPAPAGGLAIAITSADPAIARVLAETVFVAQGASTVNATVEGVALGTVNFVATNPNYAQDVSSVRVAAELNFTAASVALNGSFGSPATVRLESAGSPVSAPTGGIPLAFVSRNAACAAAPAATTIAAGLVSANVNVVYGGSAALPCNTYIVVTGPEGFVSDSISANVADVPRFIRANSTLGHGLQRNLGANLSASNHGGITVKVTSLDSSIVRVAASVSATATGSFETVVPIAGNSIPLVIAALPTGRVADTVGVRIEAPGFTTLTFNVFVFQPVYQLTSLLTTATTLAVDDPFFISIGTPSTPTGTTIFNSDPVRVGGGPVSASVIIDTPGVGRLVTSAGTADSVLLLIPEGSTSTPASVAAGGAAFRPLTPGTATVRASVPGMRALAGATGTVTITQPSITLNADYVGSGLQRSRTVTTSGSPAPAGGTPITITAARTGLVQFAPNATTAGTDTLVVTIPEGSTSTTFVVQAADGIVQDSVLLSATAPGFTSASAMQRVWQAVYTLNGLNASGTPFTADDAFYVSVGSPSSPTGTSIFTNDVRRAGAPPFEVSVVNGTPATGTLVRTGPVLADSVLITIPAGSANTPTTVASGGVAFRYLAAGTSTVRATIPGAGLRALATATEPVTVTTTAVTLSDDYVGSGLQHARSVGLTAPAPTGGVPVTITTDRLGVVKFAPNATTVGTDTLVVTIPAGSNSASFVVQGMEGIVNDSVTIIGTSPGYSDGTGTQRVWQGVVELTGLVTSLNTLTADDVFQAIVGTPSTAGGAGIWLGDVFRFGGPGATVTFTSGTSTVAQLISTAGASDTVTATITPGTRITAASVALGGVALQPLTTGTTVVRASIPGFRAVGTAIGTTVTVTAPAVALTTPANVGSGLQVAASGSVNAPQHGGINVVVKSSNPALVRVAPSAAVAATDSIVIALANGTSSFSYVVAAQDEVVGQASITASAVGFTDAVATATVVAPAIQLSGLVTARSALGADDPFQVQVGVPVANLASLNVAQARRAGAAPLVVRISTSDVAVGSLVTTARTGDTVTVEIPATASSSAATVAAGGVAFRYLTAGSTTVRISHPTIQSTTTNGSAVITVSPQTVTLAALPTVGAGLQAPTSGTLSGLQHGGTAVVIRSSDPTRLKIAGLATDLAADSIVINVPDQSVNFSFHIVGMEGTTGTATVTATAVGHVQAQQTATIVAPRIEISGLVASKTTASADDPFIVRVGVPNGTNTGLTAAQAVRAGAAPLDITLTSSAPAVGTLVTSATTAGSLSMQILAGTSTTPSTVATGGVAFRSLTAGTTTVQVSHATLLTTTTGTVVVTISP